MVFSAVLAFNPNTTENTRELVTNSYKVEAGMRYLMPESRQSRK
jgi:hypothetical protein